MFLVLFYFILLKPLIDRFIFEKLFKSFLQNILSICGQAVSTNILLCSTFFSKREKELSAICRYVAGKFGKNDKKNCLKNGLNIELVFDISRNKQTKKREQQTKERGFTTGAKQNFKHTKRELVVESKHNATSSSQFFISKMVLSSRPDKYFRCEENS